MFPNTDPLKKAFKALTKEKLQEWLTENGFEDVRKNFSLLNGNDVYFLSEEMLCSFCKSYSEGIQLHIKIHAKHPFINISIQPNVNEEFSDFKKLYMYEDCPQWLKKIIIDETTLGKTKTSNLKIRWPNGIDTVLTKDDINWYFGNGESYRVMCLQAADGKTVDLILENHENRIKALLKQMQK